MRRRHGPSRPACLSVFSRTIQNMTGSLVSQYGGNPDWDATKRLHDGQITWSFQVRLQEASEWVPFDEFTFPDTWLDEEYSGQQSFDCWLGDPLEFARTELESALVGILATLANVECVRISVWTTQEPPCDPFAVVQATDAQMEIGQLRAARENVAAATRALDDARARLRDQILRMHSQRLLGANKIAQEVGGGLTRRLVLGLIAGREIVKSVQWIITGNSEPVFYWDRSILYFEPSRPLERYSGPFMCGPLILTLDVDGTVSAEFDKQDDCYMYDCEDEDSLTKYRADVLAQATVQAAELLPKLQSRSIVLVNSDGTVAGVDDLAQTRVDRNKVLIVRRN